MPLDKLQETRAEENQEKRALVSALEENQSIKQERDPTGLQPILPTLSVQEDNTNNPCRESPNLPTETLKELISLQAKQTELSSLLIQQKKVHLPAKEPPVFSGNAFDYPAFTTAGLPV